MKTGTLIHAIGLSRLNARCLLVGAVALVSASSDVFGQQCPGAWVQIGSGGPPPRSDAGMAYDVQHDRMVLFGGGSSAGALGDTWTWDGAKWTQMQGQGPSARDGLSLTYDSARSRVVLFGGGAYFHDTWEWDGVQWTLITQSGPIGRVGAAMGFDPSRSKAVLFGGGTGSGGVFATICGSGTGARGRSLRTLVRGPAPGRLHAWISVERIRRSCFLEDIRAVCWLTPGFGTELPG